MAEIAAVREQDGPQNAGHGREQRLTVCREPCLAGLNRPNEPPRGKLPDAGFSVRARGDQGLAVRSEQGAAADEILGVVTEAGCPQPCDRCLGKRVTVSINSGSTRDGLAFRRSLFS